MQIESISEIIKEKKWEQISQTALIVFREISVQKDCKFCDSAYLKDTIDIRLTKNTKLFELK